MVSHRRGDQSVSEATIQEIVQRIKDKAGPEGQQVQALTRGRRLGPPLGGRKHRGARSFSGGVRPRDSKDSNSGEGINTEASETNDDCKIIGGWCCQFDIN